MNVLKLFLPHSESQQIQTESLKLRSRDGPRRLKEKKKKQIKMNYHQRAILTIIIVVQLRTNLLGIAPNHKIIEIAGVVDIKITHGDSSCPVEILLLLYRIGTHRIAWIKAKLIS